MSFLKKNMERISEYSDIEDSNSLTSILSLKQFISILYNDYLFKHKKELMNIHLSELSRYLNINNIKKSRGMGQNE